MHEKLQVPACTRNRVLGPAQGSLYLRTPCPPRMLALPVYWLKFFNQFKTQLVLVIPDLCQNHLSDIDKLSSLIHCISLFYFLTGFLTLCLTLQKLLEHRDPTCVVSTNPITQGNGVEPD